jgi:hypothetical protein
MTANVSLSALYRAKVRSILRQRGQFFALLNQCTCANDLCGRVGVSRGTRDFGSRVTRSPGLSAGDIDYRPRCAGSGGPSGRAGRSRN